MPTYKAIVAYDGTDYHGWQIQPQAITIAGLLQTSFQAVFNKPVKIVGASRTDAGVHALGQVGRFATDFHIDEERLMSAWNNVLPPAITIRSLSQVPTSFHPQALVREKTYYYHIFESKPLPFVARYGYALKKKIDFERLYEALQVFVGTHDFRSFCTGHEQETTVRTINNIDVSYVNHVRVWQIRVRGQSFLRYMIRRIVGAALDSAYSPSRSGEELCYALDQKNPQQHFMTAPARGLLLRSIRYY